MTQEARMGLLASIGAYTLWGFLPLYFQLITHIDPGLMLAHRIIWSVPTALIAIAAVSQWQALRQALSIVNLKWAILAGLLIGINWLTYVIAVFSGHILEASLGYFLNPLISVALGAIVFSEKLSRLQLLAVIVAALGVLYQIIAIGEPPWFALILAVSFAIYGTIKKQIDVTARAGFAVEVFVLVPIAVIWLGYLVSNGGDILPDVRHGEALNLFYLMLLGPITAAPLILFAIGARRLRLSTIGMLQYLGPSLQFMIGIMLGEAFTLTHAVTFGMIWLALILYTLGNRKNGGEIRQDPKTSSDHA